MRKIVLLGLVLLIIISTVSASKIHGTVYDISLNKVENVIVSINTNPMQRFVAKNGSYFFEVSNGDYEIVANYEDEKTIELISVKDEGTYILDLFVYPEIVDDMIEDIEIISPYEKKQSYFMYLIPVILLMFLFLIITIRMNLFIKQKETKSDLDLINQDLIKLLKFIKKNGGRVTQKELRPLFLK